MAAKLYVGKLPYAWGDNDLANLFSEIGEVESATIIMDRELNRSKGFGFVQMKNDDDAQKAVDTLNNKEVDGRNIVVNEARPSKFER